MSQKHTLAASLRRSRATVQVAVAFIAILVACTGTPTATQVPPTLAPTQAPPTVTQAPTETQPSATATATQAPTATTAAPTATPDGRMASPLVAASVCKNCHSDIYDEWAQSYHAKTLTIITAGVAGYINYVKGKKGSVSPADLMGCLGCHAPAMRFASDSDLQRFTTLVLEDKRDALSNLGVDCVACHTLMASGKPWERPDEKQLPVYGPIKDPIEAKDPATGAMAHTSFYSEKMSKSEMCATCHTYLKPEDIQVQGDWNIVCTLTYDAWSVASTGKGAGKECQNCHMPTKDGTTVQWRGATPPTRTVSSHLFPGWHSNAFLSQSANMALASKVDGNNMIVSVTVNNNAGHRMPDA